MNEFSDSTNLYFTLIIFSIIYTWIYTIHIISKMNLGIDSLQCNPYALLIGSFIDSLTKSNRSERVFKKCIKKAAKKQLYQGHVNDMEKKNESLDKAVEYVKQKSNNNTSNMNIKNTELLNLIDNANQTINETIDKQNKINETIRSTSGPITDLSTKVADITKSFKDSITKLLNNDTFMQ